MRTDLRADLLALRRRDEETRARLAAGGELFAGYAAEMERVHLENADRLERILDETGWPRRSEVGDDGAEAAWLVAQHAIGRPPFQRRCLRLLAEAVAAGEASPAHLALLTDRIRFNERRPQIYGTVFDWDERGEMSPWPIADPEGVDERRAGAGLPPLAEAVAAQRREVAASGERPPASYEARQAEIAAWARRAGWLGPDT